MIIAIYYIDFLIILGGKGILFYRRYIQLINSDGIYNVITILCYNVIFMQFYYEDFEAANSLLSKSSTLITAFLPISALISNCASVSVIAFAANPNLAALSN